jgi:hypothetical protein
VAIRDREIAGAQRGLGKRFARPLGLDPRVGEDSPAESITEMSSPILTGRPRSGRMAPIERANGAGWWRASALSNSASFFILSRSIDSAYLNGIGLEACSPAVESHESAS